MSCCEDTFNNDMKILQELLTKFIIKFKKFPDESCLEYQPNLISLKSLIDKSLIFTEETSNLLELKNELITIPDSLPFNFNLKSFTENGIDLLYYYRIGLYLNQIELAIDDEISGIHPRNVVTGLIKGTGIAHLFSFKKNQNNGDYKNYFDQSDTLQLFELFENRFINNISPSYDIIKEVIRYTKNPSLPIEKQITVNPMFEKEFK
ncbi:unnamed protein product [Rhizophagus irregularis]|nr:unnamed protein product [Rhizophagus irregularis]